MFKFDFNIEDGENHTVTEDPSNGRPHSTKPPDVDNRPLVELRLVDMLEALPYDMSYSSIHTGSLRIPRRDLFDVRMRLMTLEAQTERENQSMKVASDADAAIEFASRPSDLVPRVYEGGLKTWECSLDLADYIVNSQAQIEDLRGKRIIELGCGTAMPTLSIIQKLLNQPLPGDNNHKTIIHLQDYNASVLEYVTLPNIILVWFFSKAGESFRATLPPPSPKQSDKALPDVSLKLDSITEEGEEEEYGEGPTSTHSAVQSQAHIYDLTIPGDLVISHNLRSTFLASLDEHNIEIRFFSGPWDKFHPHIALSNRTSYDLVLTSETIYQPTSLPSLVRLLRDATGAGGQSVCLVAAKLVYFGVGGGIKEFERALGERGVKGTIQNVWDHKEGVGRCILRIQFE